MNKSIFYLIFFGIISLSIWSCEEFLDEESVDPDKIITEEDIAESDALVDEGNVELENVFSELYDSDEPDSVQGLLDMVDFSDAYDSFDEARTVNPENYDAHLGASLTGLLQVTQDQSFRDMVDSWDNYFANTTPFEVEQSESQILGRNGFGLPISQEGMQIPISSFVGVPLNMAKITQEDVPQLSDLQTVISSVLLPYIDQGITSLNLIEDLPDSIEFVFTVSTEMQPDVESGELELDLTEVYLMNMMMHALKGVLNTMLAYNFDFVTHDAAGIESELNLNSDFATLKSDGAERLAVAFTAMNTAIDKFEAAVTYNYNETDDDFDDLIPRIDQDEYLDVIEGIQDARDILNQPSWIIDEGCDEDYYYDDYYYDNCNEDSIQVDIQQFWVNPISDMKQMIPSYTIAAALDSSWDWDYEYGHLYDEWTFVRPGEDDCGGWGDYFEAEITGSPNDPNDTGGHYWYYGCPPEGIEDTLQNLYNNLVDEHFSVINNGATSYIRVWMYSNYNVDYGETFTLYEADWSRQWEDIEGVYSYPVITWDADTYDEWKNGWPDPTFNGLFPTWTVDDLMEFLDFEDGDDWDKTWD